MRFSKYYYLIIVFYFFLKGPLVAVENADLIVAQGGSGNYTTIQAAIDAAPSNANNHFIILIKKGT